MARRRKGKLAVALAAGFVLILLLEVIAMFAPALSGLFGHSRLELEVLAPRGAEARFQELGEAAAKRLGAGFRLTVVNATAPRGDGFAAAVLYVNGEPVVAAIVPPSVNSTVLAETLSYMLRVAEARLPGNETLLYIGGDKFYRLPRDAARVKQILAEMLQQIAALHAAAGAGNATAANSSAAGAPASSGGNATGTQPASQAGNATGRGG